MTNESDNLAALRCRVIFFRGSVVTVFGGADEIEWSQNPD